jgi:hypothetical protein
LVDAPFIISVNTTFTAGRVSPVFESVIVPDKIPL